MIPEEKSRPGGWTIVAISIGLVVGVALLVLVGFKTVDFIRGVMPLSSEEDTPSLYIGAGTQFHADIPAGRPSMPCTISAVGDGPEGKFAISSGQCVSSSGIQISAKGELIGVVDIANITVGIPTSGDYVYDYGLISLNNSVTLTPSGIADIGFPRMGETVCMDGSVTGWSCGEVGISSGGIIHVSGLSPIMGDQGAPLLSEDGSILYGMLSDLPNEVRAETTFASTEVSMNRLTEESELTRNGEIR